MVNVLKRRSQRLSRRKETLINKSHEMAILCDVDVALFLRIRKTGRIITYNSLEVEVEVESWPPSWPGKCRWKGLDTSSSRQGQAPWQVQYEWLETRYKYLHHRGIVTERRAKQRQAYPQATETVAYAVETKEEMSCLTTRSRSE